MWTTQKLAHLSTTRRALSNRFLTHATHTHATDQHVEWWVCFETALLATAMLMSLILFSPALISFHFRPYAFDVHANSFFPLFLQLYVAQLLLAPVVTRHNWVCLWVGNTLYLSAVSLNPMLDECFGRRPRSLIPLLSTRSSLNTST